MYILHPCRVHRAQGVPPPGRWCGPAPEMARIERQGGTKTDHFCRDNAGIIRSVLMQLEESEVTEKCDGDSRRVSRVGQQDLDRIAGSLFFDDEEE